MADRDKPRLAERMGKEPSREEEDAERKRLSERMSETTGRAPESEENALPTSQEAADDPVGTLERLENEHEGAHQTPEQRAQAAVTASSDPRDAHRLVRAEGDAHKVDPEATPEKIMSLENEALTTSASELEYSASSGALAINVQGLSSADAISGLRTALSWAMDKLMHPNEIMDFCQQHGKVPITHMCSIHRNEQYAQALKMLNEGTDDDESEPL